MYPQIGDTTEVSPPPLYGRDLQTSAFRLEFGCIMQSRAEIERIRPHSIKSLSGPLLKRLIMVHLLLRIAVWVLVLGIGYLVIGPKLFDTSPSVSPFESKSTIFLPAPKSQRLLEYDEIIKERGLTADEAAEYRRLVEERESKFWQREGISVEEALSGVKTQRKEQLVAILEQRGLTREEIGVFLLVVARDHPTLLADQE